MSNLFMQIQVSELLLSGLFAFGATAGAAFVFNTSKYDILWAAITGGIGWITYIFIKSVTKSDAAGYLAGAFVVALISEILAFCIKNPATVYLLSGLLPLVPGGGMYMTMRAVVKGNMEEALSVGFSTLTSAGAIALGIAIVLSAARLLSLLLNQKKMHKYTQNIHF